MRPHSRVDKYSHPLYLNCITTHRTMSKLHSYYKRQQPIPTAPYNTHCPPPLHPNVPTTTLPLCPLVGELVCPLPLLRLPRHLTAMQSFAAWVSYWTERSTQHEFYGTTPNNLRPSLVTDEATRKATRVPPSRFSRTDRTTRNGGKRAQTRIWDTFC